MRTVFKDELAEILNKHKMWLSGEVGGIRADLYGTDLYGTDLYRADFRWADLRWANLAMADLSGANLSLANLSRADMTGANLSGADLTKANLTGTNLSGVDLTDADLRSADLHEADLHWANICNANLRGANLYGANIRNANLCGVKNLNLPIACPEKGTFTAFKKARGYIIELEIPDDALRSSSTTRKCRCSKAKVISITNLDGTPSDVKSVASGYNSKFIYTIGETVEVPNFDTNRWNECAPGIHFFITRQEAVDFGS